MDKPETTGKPKAAAPAKKALKIYIDGEFFDEADAKISVFDHGLLYGDGVFEGIRFYNGRVFRMEDHMERLWDSARSICLDISMSRSELDEALLETIRQNNLRDGYVRLIVTRGVGNLGLNPVQCKRSSVIIIASTIALYPEEMYRAGLTVVTVPTRRMGPATLNPAIKSLNYLNNVLARIEANLANADEALAVLESPPIVRHLSKQAAPPAPPRPPHPNPPRVRAPASSSRGVNPSRWMVAWIVGHCSLSNLWRSARSNRARAPSLMNMPRPRFFSTSCSSTSC